MVKSTLHLLVAAILSVAPLSACGGKSAPATTSNAAPAPDAGTPEASCVLVRTCCGSGCGTPEEALEAGLESCPAVECADPGPPPECGIVDGECRAL